MKFDKILAEDLAYEQRKKEKSLKFYVTMSLISKFS